MKREAWEEGIEVGTGKRKTVNDQEKEKKGKKTDGEKTNQVARVGTKITVGKEGIRRHHGAENDGK